MRNFQRIVIASLFVTPILVSGCEKSSENTAVNVQKTSQQDNSEASTKTQSDNPKPLAETPEPSAAADSTKIRQAAPAAAAIPPLTEAEAALTTTDQAPTPPRAVPVPPPTDPIDPTDPHSPPAAATPQLKQLAEGEVFVQVEPKEIDMGDVPTNDTKKATFAVINTSDTPRTIVKISTSCGCTIVKNFSPNTVVAPQEKLELEVQLSGGSRPGPIHGKTVTVNVEGQPPVIVQLKGQAISLVTLEPATLDPETMPEGKFKLKAADGQPFRIMSAQPAVIEGYDKESKAEHELTMSWDKFREIGVRRQTVVYLDHPKCQQVLIPVNFKQEEVAAAAAREAELRRQQRGINDENVPGEDGVKPDPNLPRAQPMADPDATLANLVKDGKNDEVLKRIATGLDVNHRVNHADAKNAPLLSLAAKHGNVELIQALLATKKAEIEAADAAGRTPLMHAAQSKNAQAVRALLDAGANVSTRDTLNGTALSWAAGFGNAACVKELVSAKSDVEVVGSITGWTPLLWAVGFGEFESIEPLLDAGANIEVADYIQGATPLIFAARTGKLEAIQILLERGARLETADHNGNTPFLAAAGNSGGTAEKVKALIDAGANIHAKDNRGLNALQVARKRTDIRAADVIKVLEPLLGSETPVEESGEKPAGQPSPTP